MMYGTEVRFRIWSNAEALTRRLYNAGFEVRLVPDLDENGTLVYDLATDARVEYVDGVWVIEGENV